MLLTYFLFTVFGQYVISVYYMCSDHTCAYRQMYVYIVMYRYVYCHEYMPYHSTNSVFWYEDSTIIQKYK